MPASFQLDECLNDRNLAGACNQQALAEVCLFPSNRKGQIDPDLIPAFVIPNGKTFLTKDRNIAKEHCAHIPEAHPGFVIIANSYKCSRNLDRKEVNLIIDRFKKRFPDWHTLAWNNSIVELTQHTVQLQHVTDGNTKPIDDGLWEYEHEGWSDEFKGLLERNSRRHRNLLG